MVSYTFFDRQNDLVSVLLFSVFKFRRVVYQIEGLRQHQHKVVGVVTCLCISVSHKHMLDFLWPSTVI